MFSAISRLLSRFWAYCLSCVDIELVWAYLVVFLVALVIYRFSGSLPLLFY